jgi:hypothetical protein
VLRSQSGSAAQASFNSFLLNPALQQWRKITPHYPQKKKDLSSSADFFEVLLISVPRATAKQEITEVG